uniref:NADH dehydrogenase [ubiquinone] 1 beta subcomplex subunit 11, mitochondrial n=1 Tax=Chlamydomonas leiostraca TaxID=1034604 RepID=A0A7S0WVN2_9CHLO|mmetsp:Transcript_31300/g.79836  ORF Transcript_31300/g.79836 Transcript_31300/m.79836 type:complete len:171 (+) Transcript_31300:61-573(+)
MNRLGQVLRLGTRTLRAQRGGGAAEWPGGSFWSEGTQTGKNGFLFGELPPKAGEGRKIQWWEPIWYGGYAAFFAGIYAIYHAKPEEALDIKYWARPRAEKELDVEMKMLDKLSQRPDLKDKLTSIAKQLNLVEEEIYDLVLMRSEYKVLLGLHSGRVPTELQEVYDELAA